MLRLWRLRHLPKGHQEAPAMPRTINQAGVDLIKSFEQCRLHAYQDVRGIWTIGWGHTGDVADGMIITQQEADDFLRGDLNSAVTAVSRGIIGGAATTDNQFGAMVSLGYNIGLGAFTVSTVLRQHRLGAYQQAADAFRMWNKATINGVLQPVAGLTRRREAERTLYLLRP